MPPSFTHRIMYSISTISALSVILFAAMLHTVRAGAYGGHHAGPFRHIFENIHCHLHTNNIRTTRISNSIIRYATICQFFKGL